MAFIFPHIYVLFSLFIWWTRGDKVLLIQNGGRKTKKASAVFKAVFFKLSKKSYMSTQIWYMILLGSRRWETCQTGFGVFSKKVGVVKGKVFWGLFLYVGSAPEWDKYINLVSYGKKWKNVPGIALESTGASAFQRIKTVKPQGGFPRGDKCRATRHSIVKIE